MLVKTPLRYEVFFLEQACFCVGDSHYYVLWPERMPFDVI